MFKESVYKKIIFEVYKVYFKLCDIRVCIKNENFMYLQCVEGSYKGSENIEDVKVTKNVFFLQ